MNAKSNLHRLWHRKEGWTEFGEGMNLDSPEKKLTLKIPEKDRPGQFWCFGTTRVGKTRLLEHLVEQDIRKGYSVVCIDPKGDIEMFSKIVQVAFDTKRTDDLMLVTPIFPELSAVLDPLSSYYMPEELVAHITAGVPVGREPYFFGVAYEVSLVVVQALMELAKYEGRSAFFNLIGVKNQISHGDLIDLKEKIDRLDTPESEQISLDLQKILDSTPDYYSKVASSLRVALTELTAGNIGQIIGQADENRFITRLEQGKQVIMMVQLGSLLTKKASYTAGKVVVSMLQSFIGRRLASGQKVTPPLALHIDEAQSILYQGIEDLFAKAGGAGIYVHGYSQSINQIHAEVGRERGNSILDNCNTKIFMRVPDATTADYVSTHLGEKRVFSPLISLGGGLAVRETEDKRIKVSDVLNLGQREFYLITYSGTYKGRTADVEQAVINVSFPDVNTVQAPDPEEAKETTVEEEPVEPEAESDENSD